MSVCPAHREADVVLSDGSTVSLRPVRRDDEAALRTFFAALDERSQSFRFLSGVADPAEVVHRVDQATGTHAAGTHGLGEAQPPQQPPAQG